MEWHANVLVVANVTATSTLLVAALTDRAGRGPIGVTLLLPAAQTGLSGREASRPALEEALAAWREAGIEAEGVVGDHDPIEAVHDVWDPGALRRGDRLHPPRPGLALAAHRPPAPRRGFHRRPRYPRRRHGHAPGAGPRPAAGGRALAARPPFRPLLGRRLEPRPPRLARRGQERPHRVGTQAAARARARAPRWPPATRRRCAPRRPRRAGSQPPAAGGGAARSASSVRAMTSVSLSGRRPQSITRPPAIHSASQRPWALGCGARTSREPAWIARSTPPRRSSSARSRPWRRRSQAARSKRALGRRGVHLGLDVGEQRPGAVAAGEQPERGVQALAVEVRVEVAQARREAAAHLPVDGGMLAPRQRPAAVAQAEERVELLDQLGGGRPPAQRADGHRVPRGGLAGDLEDRERDVEAAAQVDELVGRALQARVAGR